MPNSYSYIKQLPLPRNSGWSQSLATVVSHSHEPGLVFLDDVPHASHDLVPLTLLQRSLAEQ